VPTARQALELLDPAFGIVAGQFLQVIVDQLIEALAESVSLLSCACGKLLVDRERDFHLSSIPALGPGLSGAPRRGKPRFYGSDCAAAVALWVSMA